MQTQYAVYVAASASYSDPEQLVEFAVAAEESGWDGFFVWDHLVSSIDFAEPVADAPTVLALVAAETKRIAFGSLITPLARRELSKVALEVVTLDQLSRGRLIFGAGLGAKRDFCAFGLDAGVATRAARLDDRLAKLKKLWKGESLKVVLEGECANATLQPRPYNNRSIPVWIGLRWPSKGDQPFERTARWDGVFPVGGDNWNPSSSPLSPKDVADVLAKVKTISGSGLSADYVVAHAGRTSGTDRARDRADVASYTKVGVNWWLESFIPWNEGPEEALGRIKSGPPS